MATKTPNYNLTKPDQNDFYNVQDFNGNNEIIDAELKRLSDQKADLGEDGKIPADLMPEGAMSSEIIGKPGGAASLDEDGKVPAEQLPDMDFAKSSHDHTAAEIKGGTFPETGVSAQTGTDYAAARIRNIQASTTDLTAGTSALANGDIYLVYE